MTNWRREPEAMISARALMAVPALFAAFAIAGMIVVGGPADTLTTPLFYLAGVVVTVVLLVGLALPVDSPEARSRIGTLAGAALLLGFAELSLIAFAPMAYGPGGTRTDWIEGTALWVGAVSVLVSLAVIVAGIVASARWRRQGGPGPWVARLLLLLGVVLGASAYHFAVIAISYDLSL